MVEQFIQHSAVAHDPGGRQKRAWPNGSRISAQFSDCGLYRYALAEIWNEELPAIMFLMMNPSVAGMDSADPTLIKSGRFARAWGYGGQLVGNVHSYRITESKRLAEIEDPVGPENDAALLKMAASAGTVVLAYGLPPNPLRPRAQAVIQMLGKIARLKFIRLTKDGTPSHPLYLPHGLPAQDYVVAT